MHPTSPLGNHETQFHLNRRENPFREMMEALGGQEKYRELPTLENEDYIPSHMPHSVMKGTFAGNPLIVLKLRAKDENLVFSIRFSLYNSAWHLQGYNAGAEKNPNYHSHYAEFRNDLIGTIRQIAVDQNHPRLELA